MTFTEDELSVFSLMVSEGRLWPIRTTERQDNVLLGLAQRVIREQALSEVGVAW